MLNDCYKYATVVRPVNDKIQSFPNYALLIALLCSQYKMIERITETTSKYKSVNNNNNNNNIIIT
jgi:hypothetical protein